MGKITPKYEIITLKQLQNMSGGFLFTNRKRKNKKKNCAQTLETLKNELNEININDYKLSEIPIRFRLQMKLFILLKDKLDDITKLILNKNLSNWYKYEKLIMKKQGQVGGIDDAIDILDSMQEILTDTEIEEKDIFKKIEEGEEQDKEDKQKGGFFTTNRRPKLTAEDAQAEINKIGKIKYETINLEIPDTEKISDVEYDEFLKSLN